MNSNNVAQIVVLSREKSPKISLEYADYAKVFSFEKSVKLPEQSFNKQMINFEKSMSLHHELFQSLEPLKLEI